MKKILTIILLISVFQLHAQVEVEFTPTDSLFSIVFQGQPEYSTSDVEVDEGILEMHIYMDTRNQFLNMVAHVNYPQDTYGSIDGSILFYESVASGFFGSLGIPEYSKAKVKNGKNEGMKFKGNTDNHYVVYHIYSKNNILFQVVMMNVEKYPSNKQEKKYFKSFKIH